VLLGGDGFGLWRKPVKSAVQFIPVRFVAYSHQQRDALTVLKPEKTPPCGK